MANIKVYKRPVCTTVTHTHTYTDQEMDTPLAKGENLEIWLKCKQITCIDLFAVRWRDCKLCTPRVWRIFVREKKSNCNIFETMRAGAKCELTINVSRNLLPTGPLRPMYFVTLWYARHRRRTNITHYRQRNYVKKTSIKRGVFLYVLWAQIYFILYFCYFFPMLIVFIVFAVRRGEINVNPPLFLLLFYL